MSRSLFDGRYEVLRRLGGGGMAEVHWARDDNDGDSRNDDRDDRDGDRDDGQDDRDERGEDRDDDGRDDRDDDDGGDADRLLNAMEDFAGYHRS